MKRATASATDMTLSTSARGFWANARRAASEPGSVKRGGEFTLFAHLRQRLIHDFVGQEHTFLSQLLDQWPGREKEAVGFGGQN